MESNLARHLPEGKTPDFHQDRRRRFKERMELSVLLSKRPRKAIAEDMGVCEASFSDWLNSGKRESMPAHFLDAWTREVGRDILQWVAKENGLELVPLADTTPEVVADGNQLLALISIHHGKTMGAMIQAREDRVIEEREKRAIFPDIQRLIRELEAEAELFRPSMER